MATIWRVTTTMTGVIGGPYVNQLHFEDQTLQDAGAAHAVAAEFWSAAGAGSAVGLAGTVGGEVELIEDSTGAIVGVEAVTPVTFAGAAAGELLPPTTQGLISLRTGVFSGGREIRGRVFVPAIPDQWNDQGVPSSQYVDALTSWGADLVNTGCVIYSPTKATSAPVTAAIGRSYWASLRSRRD